MLRFYLLALLLTLGLSQDLSSLETTFILRYTQNQTECAETIKHATIREYTNLVEDDSVPGVLWRDLRVNGASCEASPLPQAATYFVAQTPSPAGTATVNANAWFAIGRDNSARRCATFRARWAADYFCTNDMPRFRQRFIDDGLLPIEGVAENSFRGQVWMFSRERSEDGVLANTVCVYEELESEPEEEPEPEKERIEEEGPACFEGGSMVRTAGGWKKVEHLKEGDIVKGENWDWIRSFSHRDPGVWAWFVRLAVENSTLSLTEGHYVNAQGGLKRAGELRAGDVVRMERGWGRVAQVTRGWGKGVYSPITEGSIVVNDVLCSVYTDVMPVSMAHALLVPVRVGGRWEVVLEGLRWLVFGKWQKG